MSASVRPVPGFESLVWAGEHLRAEEDRVHRVRIARAGEDDAVLVYATRVGRNDVLFSRHLRGAFTRWPPEIDAPIVRQSGDFGNATGPLMAWPDGTFAVRTGSAAGVVAGAARTIVAAIDAPGATWAFRGVACFEPAPLEGMYLFSSEHGQTRVLHRSVRAEEAHVVVCGVAPAVTHYVATELGTLVMAALSKEGDCQLFVVTRSGVHKATKISGVERSRCFLLARRGGGAFVVFAGHRGDIFAQRIDEDGQLVGDRFTHEGQHNLFAAGAWNDGFVLQMRLGSGGLGAVVSDGVNATTIHAPLTGEVAMGLEGSLASSADGSVVLFAYESSGGLRVGRLLAGGSEVLLAETALARSSGVAVRTPVAARPHAGPPVYVLPKLGTRDELVSLVLGCEYATGDLRSGSFDVENGQGAHCVFAWDEAGLVALGYDQDDDATSEWRLELDLRDPGKYLLEVPPALRELATRVTDMGARLATEGYWVEAGERPAYRASSTEVLEQFLGVRDRHGPVAPEELDETTSAEDEGELALAESTKDEVVLEQRLSSADRALLVAAHAGDLDGVKKALADGANINVPMPNDELPATPEACPPLIVALRRDHRAVVEYLIEVGANVNASSSSRGDYAGPETALRLAATQGNAELTRALLARGASVSPDASRLGLLEQLTDWHLLRARGLRRGPPEAYAEVIRMLLDAGAPLPNDLHCDALVRLAIDGGAPELESRLRRVYAEVVLPDEPAPLDTAASVARVSELLGRASDASARDTVATLRLLNEAWQLSLNPRIGDAAEGIARLIYGAMTAVGAGLSADSAPSKKGEALFAEVRALREGPVDARAARAILSWLWTTDSTDRSWLARSEDEAAAMLVMLRDVRFLESLEQHCDLRRPNSWHPVRASLQMALRVMKEVVPGALSEADVDHLGTIEDRIAGRRPIAQRPTIRDLYAAVYDARHDDDGPRRELAARLIEAGDPRGELIELQLNRIGARITEREKELLTVHGRAWLGEIGRVLAGDFVYERGFLVEASTGDGNEQRRPIGYPLPSGGGTQLEWSTVRRLSFCRDADTSGTFGLLRGARIQRVVELLEVGAGGVRDLLAGRARPCLERLDLALDRVHHRPMSIPDDRWSSLPDKLPSLTSLRVGLRADGLEGAARLAARLPHLRELAIGTGQEPALSELIALARQRNLTKVRALGLVDFSFAPETNLLEVSFTGRLSPEQAPFIAAALSNARDIGAKRVVLRTPVRAKIEPDANGRPAMIKRRSESIDLTRILEAVESMGLACEFE